MKKLRLIKPWDLEAVYQKAAIRPDFNEVALVPVSCGGPQAPDAGAYAESRGSLSHMNGRYLANANPAPESRAIFAAVSNPRMG